MDEIYWTVKEVAKRFKISERQVTEFARSGILPGIRIGRLWRFRIDAVERWEEGQTVDEGIRFEPVEREKE